MNIESISLDRIDVGARLRGTDPDYVAWIADNIQQNGQLQPILVRRTEGGRFALVDGGHRLEAARQIGLPRISVAVLENADDERAEIYEIDANLVRADLNPLDRAVFLGRRAAIYEAENPDAKRGKKGAMARWHMQTAIVSFASDAEEKLGISKRTIERAIQVARGLKPELRQRLAGTWLAQDQNQLLALAKLEPDEQVQAVELLLHPVQPRKNVAEAQREVRGIQKPVIAPEDEEYRRLIGAWTKAGKSARTRFVDHVMASGDYHAAKPAKLGKAA